MTSLLASPKQSAGHFINISTGGLTLKNYTPGSGSGGSFTVGSFTNNGNVVPAYTLLRDLGKTVVSSLRMFRLVAPVYNLSGANPYPPGNDTNVTFGVSTTVAGVPIVGYVELGAEGTGTADPVARFNSL